MEALCYKYMKTKGCIVCNINTSKSQAYIIFHHIFYTRELINSNFNNKTENTNVTQFKVMIISRLMLKLISYLLWENKNTISFGIYMPMVEWQFCFVDYVCHVIYSYHSVLLFCMCFQGVHRTVTFLTIVFTLFVCFLYANGTETIRLYKRSEQ